MPNHIKQRCSVLKLVYIRVLNSFDRSLAGERWSEAGESHIRKQMFEVGDEVIGDERIRGIIIATHDAFQQVAENHADVIREYFVQNEDGEKFLYAGEKKLRLVKKGMGDAAPPRPEFLKALEEDLKRRPLVGLRA